MSLAWALSAYCDDCGFDVLTSESDDLDALTLSMEAKVDYLYTEHIRQGKCE